jgi:hypothetical protein
MPLVRANRKTPDSSPSDRNPLDFIEARLVAGTVVRLRGTVRLVVDDRPNVFDGSALAVNGCSNWPICRFSDTLSPNSRRHQNVKRPLEPLA